MLYKNHPIYENNMELISENVFRVRTELAVYLKNHRGLCYLFSKN